MTRQCWVQHPITLKLIPKDEYIPPAKKREYAAVHGDIEAFKSPIDGSIIDDRRKLREHNHRHGVTRIEDYGPDYFERKHRERSAAMTGQDSRNKQQRIDAIREALHRHGIE